MNSDERKTERRVRRRSRKNPHGLGPMPTFEEIEARRARLVEARDTGAAAADRVTAIREKHFTGEKAVLPPIVWHGETL